MQSSSDQPARVRLHPSCVIGGQQTVEEFRMKAVELGGEFDRLQRAELGMASP